MTGPTITAKAYRDMRKSMADACSRISANRRALQAMVIITLIMIAHDPCTYSVARCANCGTVRIVSENRTPHDTMSTGIGHVDQTDHNGTTEIAL